MRCLRHWGIIRDNHYFGSSKFKCFSIPRTLIMTLYWNIVLIPLCSSECWSITSVLVVLLTIIITTWDPRRISFANVVILLWCLLVEVDMKPTNGVSLHGVGCRAGKPLGRRRSTAHDVAGVAGWNPTWRHRIELQAQRPNCLMIYQPALYQPALFPFLWFLCVPWLYHGW